jgi:hypothetical protein
MPALLYRHFIGDDPAKVVGPPATTLTFVIVATQIGLPTGKIIPAKARHCLPPGCFPPHCSHRGLRLLTRHTSLAKGSGLIDQVSAPSRRYVRQTTGRFGRSSSVGGANPSRARRGISPSGGLSALVWVAVDVCGLVRPGIG